MRKVLPLLIGLVVASVAAAAPYRVAGSTVAAGSVRVSVLSPTLVRVEASPTGKFVDEPSALVLDRNWPATPFRAGMDQDWLVVRTAALEVRCRAGQAPPTAESLSIAWRAGGRSGAWRPGQTDGGNLGGTRSALDGIKAGNLPPLDSGLLSREGWTLLDDSRRPLWLGEEEWLKPRPEAAATDWYFFAYGDDYAHMLSEYVRLCGRIPMLPRYAWGTWFSRFWDYSAAELRDIVRTFRVLDIPLDVLVIDVDWHKYGWEGYDWNEKQFPDPPGLLGWLHQQGIHVTLNNHPGSPLPVEDTHHPAAARMAGLSGEALKQPLGWDLADRKLNRAFVEAVHWPLESIGVDFWWIDGNPGANVAGLDAAMWCAKTYYDGTARRTGLRSLTFSRYGGLGQHRYPAGFSGDVYSEWDVLRYEVPFTTRAGNVAFPYWSHDIGGFMGDRLDPELYVRWCQFGALSPVLRLHSNHGVREPWEYGAEAQGIAKRYFALRHRLYPYLNSCQREAYETGMPVCRALYMHWPRLAEAYRYDHEYMLGPDLLVAPITEHTGADGVAAKEVWVPPGLWWDYWTREPVRGPKTIVYRARLDRCPLFVRAGAVIPMQPVMEHMGQRPADPITLQVWPGADGGGQLYEDDGVSMSYTAGGFASTPLRVTCGAREVRLTIGGRCGTHTGALQRRRWVVEVNGVALPQSVAVDGRSVRGWAYDAVARRVTVRVPVGSAGRGHCIAVRVGASAGVVGGQATALAYRRGALAAMEAAGGAAPPPVARALRTLADDAAQAQPGRLPQLLAEAWTALAASDLPEERRHAAMGQLVGAAATAELAPLEGTQERRLEARVATTAPLPGASVTGALVLPPGWRAVGETSGGLATFAANSAGGLTGRVQPGADLATPPLGLLEYGGDFALTWGDQTLPVRVRGGLDCSFVQQWHLIGPFPNEDSQGLDRVFPPEQGLDLSATYPGLDGLAKWQTVPWQLSAIGGDPAVFINLEPRFQPKDQAVAYGVAYVLAERETEAVLSLGSDDSCKVWLNGRLVHTFPDPRPPAPGVDKVPVTLREGRNVVLFKVVNYGGQWGLYLQVVGRDGRPLPGLRTTLEPGP